MVIRWIAGITLKNRQPAAVLILKVRAGNNVIYTSTAAATAAVGNTSDRLPTFSASAANGTSYRLVFHSNLADKNSKETILLR